MHEAGDDYIRRIAGFIRSNEQSLAAFARRPSPSTSSSWFDPAPVKPAILSLDTHHLFYLLIRLEALSIDVGPLDVRIDSPSRPMSYINLFPLPDNSDSLSLASFRSSLSVVSGLSLGIPWWGRTLPPSLDAELKYIFSSFTKLPALSILPPGRKIIAELVNDLPNENGIPLDSFRNLQSLECADIDPRSLLGWDRLAESLRILKVRKSGLEDVADIFIGAVVDDEARRQGSTSRKRQRRIPHGPSRRISFYATQLPDSVPEDSEEPGTAPILESEEPRKLSSRKWAALRHLSLPDNSLTFFPVEIVPYITGITHLDLSSNLLVSVPPGLGSLYNLISLNLSDNMIDSVLGIYLHLGQVLTLNLSRNRLEFICGLERLPGLEKVDLRSNVIDESAEIGRLATLPNIAEVLVQGNPFVEYEEGYRIVCFDYFWKEGKEILLDGTPASFHEKRGLSAPPPGQTTARQPQPAAHSPPTLAIGHAHPHYIKKSVSSPPDEEQPGSRSMPSIMSPQVGPVSVVAVIAGKARRKKAKRIVDLDGDQSDESTRSHSRGHRRIKSDSSSKEDIEESGKGKKQKQREINPPSVQTSWGQVGSLLQTDESASSGHADISKASTTNRRPSVQQSQPPDAVNTFMNPVPTFYSNLGNPPAITRPPHRSRPSRHGRYQTESSASPIFAPSLEIPPFAPLAEPNSPTTPMQTSNVQHSNSTKRLQASQTFSSKSTARRARVSASVFEAPVMASDGEERNGDMEGMVAIKESAEAYRRRIEALKNDMGEGWLKVFSQTQMKTPSG